MEELFVYSLLLNENLVTENEYRKHLNELFLENPDNEDLLFLEWETDVKNTISYIRNHIDYSHLDMECFGRFLMKKLKTAYKHLRTNMGLL